MINRPANSHNFAVSLTVFLEISYAILLNKNRNFVGNASARLSLDGTLL